MATSKRLKALIARLDEVPGPVIESVTELARHEEVRFATSFGLNRPRFRPSVRLRFYGAGVLENTLSAQTGSRVVSAFADAVDAAAAGRHLSPGQAELYLSPTVLPGSTILELFGAAREEDPGSDLLTDEIDDAPADLALGDLFDALDRVMAEAPGENAQEVDVEAQLGKSLFSLTRGLLEGSVDLHIEWTRAKGARRTIGLDRANARRLRDTLDRDFVTNKEHRAVARLIAVSTAGSITVQTKEEGTFQVHGIENAEDELRELWARDVVVEWMETVHLHPRRDRSRRTRTFMSIQQASSDQQGELDI